jgi:GxxExxY protein
METRKEPPPLKHADLTDKVIGVFYEVYNELGHGFVESVYRSAIELALRQLGIRVAREVPLPVWFRGENMGNFRADLIVEDVLLLELKSAVTIERSHEAQTLNYLRATKIEVALILNFGPRAHFRRLVFDNKEKKIGVDPRESALRVSGGA